MKHNMKKLFTFALLALGLVAGSNAKASAAKLAIDATNFPDTAIRNALTRNAKNYCMDNDGTDYNEYSSYTNDGGVYYVNTDEIRYLYVYTEDGAVENVDCLKVFPNLAEVSFDKVNASDLKFADTVTLVSLSGITSSSVKVEANGVMLLSLYANKKGTTASLPSFSNLTSLSLYNIKLPSFDGSKCSKLSFLSLDRTQTSSIKGLKNLKDLYTFSISGSTLKSLDLSSFKRLNFVNVSDNKKLTSVKLPNNVTYAYLYNNNLKSINVKNLKNLEYLNVSDNKNLRSLDISKNKKLTGVALNYTGISKINVSKNSKLVGLSCYNTKIKSLNVSKNKKLNSLKVNGNKSLKSLNVTKNKELTSLNYYGSGIKKLDLSKQKYMTLSYYNIKKGKSISLKNIIGTGYKVTYSEGGIKYNKKNGSFKVTKKGFAYLTLQKGKYIRYIYVSVK